MISCVNMKKVVFKKYLEENSQAQRLERVISGIKKEKRLRSNDELLTEVKKFKIQYSKEMEKINNQINIAKNALKRKKELKKTLLIMEEIANGANLKVVLIRLDPKEVEKINQIKRKQTNRKDGIQDDTLDGNYWSWSTTSRRTPKPIKNKSIIFISSCNLSYC